MTYASKQASTKHKALSLWDAVCWINHFNNAKHMLPCLMLWSFPQRSPVLANGPNWKWGKANRDRARGNFIFFFFFFFISFFSFSGSFYFNIQIRVFASMLHFKGQSLFHCNMYSKIFLCSIHETRIFIIICERNSELRKALIIMLNPSILVCMK